MRYVRRWSLIAVALSLAACGNGPAAPEHDGLYVYAAPPDLGDGLGGASAAAVDVDARSLQLVVRQIEDGTWPNIHSVLVHRRGQLIVEEYFSGIMPFDGIGRDFGRDSVHDMYSVSKSFTSAAVGQALEAGAIASLDQEVRDYFPEYVHLGGALASGELKVRHLLMMAAGLEWDESSTSYFDPANSNYQMRESADPIEFLFSRPQVQPPGTVWVYNTGLTSILGEIVARATGETLQDFMERELFEPLGIGPVQWRENYYNGSLAFAGGGLLLRPRDMAKLGVTYLNDGVWQGAQVVPADWVAASIAPRAPNTGYGFQWWLGARTVNGRTYPFFRAVGFLGQHIFVFPTVELVVAFTGNGSGSAPYELLDLHILPAMR